MISLCLNHLNNYPVTQNLIGSCPETARKITFVSTILLAITLPIAGLLIAPMITITIAIILASMALILCKIKKQTIASPSIFCAEKTLSLLKEYRINAWSPKHTSIKYACRVILTHKERPLQICMHKGHPFHCKHSQPHSAFVFSVLPSMERTGNVSRTHSCISSISKSLWEKMKQSPTDSLHPGECRCLVWEKDSQHPSKADYIIVFAERETPLTYEKDSLQQLLWDYERYYNTLFQICLEKKIYEIHLPLLGENLYQPTDIDNTTWVLMQATPLLRALSQLPETEPPIEIHIDNPKEIPLKGLLSF